MFQKIIATILIIGLILSLNFNLFLVKPKQAQAGDWIGGPFQIIDTIKQSVLDPITSFASKPFGKIVLFELRKLLRGEFSDANKPLAILDWSQFINERINRGSAKFIGEFNQVFDTSDPFQRGMKSALTNLGFNILHKDLDPYSRYARPTLKDDLEAAGIDYDAFVNSGYSLVQGGWAGWFSMIKPQNNIFGQILMAERARRTAEEAEAEAAKQEGLAGRGFQNRNECIKEGLDYTAYEQCVSNCVAGGGDQYVCEGGCKTAAPPEPNGVCLEYKVKNVGSELHSMVEKQVGFDIDWLVRADELEDLFSMLITTILSSITHGPGWGTAQSSAPPKSYAYKPYKKDMSYYQLKREPPTAEERAKSRTEILELIFQSIGQMSRQTSYCKSEDEEKVEQKGQMPDNREKELTKLQNRLLELLESFTMQLYLEETGVVLRPDFKVLDPANAPFKVYGQTWDEVEYHFYPPKCAKFGKKCEDFDSKLPTLETHISQGCKSCLSRVNYHLKKCKEGCGYNKECLAGCTRSKAIADAVAAGECSSAAFAQSCTNQVNLVNRVKNTCEDCIQKAEDRCESQKTDEEKIACIERFCRDDDLFSSIFTEFGIGIADGQDFLKRCEIQEKKDACFMCLKQYFMPATYPQQIRDYIGRGFIKHPYLLIEHFYARKEMSVWDVTKEYIKFILSPGLTIINWLLDLFGLGGPNIEKYWEYHLNFCVGACPEVMHTQTDCNNHTRNEEVPLGLICRVFPDSAKCRAYCDPNSLTKDPIDFEPGDDDCGNKTEKGALNPVTLVTNAAFMHRSKYCRALTGHIPEYYRKCTEPYKARTTCQQECLKSCKEEFDACQDACRYEEVFSRRGESEPLCQEDCFVERTACEQRCEGLGPCPTEEEIVKEDIVCTDPINKPEECCSEGYRPLTKFFNTREAEPFYYCSWEKFKIPTSLKEKRNVVVCSNVQPAGAVFYIAGNHCQQQGKCKSNNPTAGPRIIPVDGSRVRCSDGCDLSLSCTNLRNDNSCTIKGPIDEGAQNPCGRPPTNNIYCQWETPRALQNGQNNKQTLSCDLGGVNANNAYFSIYLNQLGDPAEKLRKGIKVKGSGLPGDYETGGQVCVKCDPNDPGYPNYGTNKDQCNFKLRRARKCP